MIFFTVVTIGLVALLAVPANTAGNFDSFTAVPYDTFKITSAQNKDPQFDPQGLYSSSLLYVRRVSRRIVHASRPRVGPPTNRPSLVINTVSSRPRSASVRHIVGCCCIRIVIHHQSYLILAHWISRLPQPHTPGLAFANHEARERKARTWDSRFKCNVGSSWKAGRG
jgi:hypothetical protein